MIRRLLRRWRDRPDPALLIRAPRQIYAGTDWEARERANEKRKREDRIRQSAARVASSSAEEGR